MKDAVIDAQRVFRRLLRAASRPGEVLALPETGDDPIEAVALTLLDGEVSFCAPGTEEREGCVARLTGARVAPVTEADFAFFFGGGSDGEVSNLKRGTLEAPEEGATAVYEVGRLSERGGERALRISGPGVPVAGVTLGVDGVSGDEFEAMKESRAGYPLGVDLYLIDGEGRISGLPRSVRVEVSA